MNMDVLPSLRKKLLPVPTDCTHLPYSETGYFTPLILDYLKQDPRLQNFYTYTPDADGLKKAIANRANYPVDRGALVSILQQQYSKLPAHEAVRENIRLLGNENTFTICTAHQPNLLTGYLYFVYKIVHAIKLAEELKQQYPDKNFVPVYYIGSEDNDLEELGVFRYEGKKFVWDADGQTGAVGRMDTKSLKKVLDELFKVMGPPGANLQQLKELLIEAYLKHKNIADATQYLVNELFGRYGLIVLNPDEAEFKKAILPILKDDLLNHGAHPLVNAQIEKLEEHYKSQAYPRPINLFYLKDNIRERIERNGDKWEVLNTEISFTETELLNELETHPERFSPNVILRGLFQETILPDVAFIGGGAEVAYWLQLKPIFEKYNVFFPVVLLRQSILWINKREHDLREKLQLSISDIFKPEESLVKGYIAKHSKDNWQTGEETATIEKIMVDLKTKATSLDATLRGSAEAAVAKMKHQLEVLEKKMLRAEKRKMETELQRINRLLAVIFPDKSLQERKENFIGWYLQYGQQYFDMLKDSIQPLKQEFLVLEEAS
jgi:bacillithiol biosynthesis cysteine-adding enzyme BshC